ncbi:MAG: hypothetical protein KA004_13690 [Verrucomicrobiales bacterium]|nr:hypothetical protein [Verrucomicrobiales bacterium]
MTRGCFLLQITGWRWCTRDSRFWTSALPEFPPDIAQAKKRGFRFPFQEWLETGFAGPFRAATDGMLVATPQRYQRWVVFMRQRLLRPS